MNVRENSGNFISSWDKRENDSLGIVTCPQNVLINNKLSFFLEKIMSKKTFFQDCWLLDPAFNSCLEKVNNDLTIFQCKFCKSQHSLSTMGKRAIIGHIEGQK